MQVFTTYKEQKGKHQVNRGLLWEYALDGFDWQKYPIMVDKAIIYFGDVDELLIPEIRMQGYQFDFAAVEKRIIKMTDNADKVYSTAPLKRTNK